MITMGGNAELELVDSLDPFSEGIVFSVMPPKKSWKNIANLSGGEKVWFTMSRSWYEHHSSFTIDSEFFGSCVCVASLQAHSFICHGWNRCGLGFQKCVDCCELHQGTHQECSVRDHQLAKQHVRACRSTRWNLQDRQYYQIHCHQSVGFGPSLLSTLFLSIV